ncbi:MCE family protein [Methylomonas paludis]|uniref:MCE family protein n=1 Tax=Methylomonas paludis TaxID=1173101 RepID=A0A975MPN3_9GAMM|nr:MlaD family protein [Methylomonas paludis]QWF71490.1 MCE family protein [Methylomonas paludis]
MSKQASPLAIGAFLCGALILLTTALMIFGGGDFFKHKNRYVIFFDSALNGLNVGAPVKLQGVQIGNVSEISLEMDLDSGRIIKPVVIDIDPDALLDFSGQAADKKQILDAKRLTAAGLKARLETQSLLTGLLYVDLNFYYDKPANLLNLEYKDLPELPSVPTTADEIKNTVEEVIKKVRELPLEQMVRDLSETLRETRNLLKSDDTKNSLAALAKTLAQTQTLIITLNTQVGPLLKNVDATVNQSRLSLETVNQQLAPVLKASEQSLNAATQVLQDSRQAVNAVEGLTNPDALLGQALKEMRDASRAMKDLSESLERQPEAIIYGK